MAYRFKCDASGKPLAAHAAACGYTIKNVFPYHPGEFCTNHPKEDRDRLREHSAEGMQRTRADDTRWLSQMYVGPPHPSPKYNVAQLEAMGMIGLYRLTITPRDSVSPKFDEIELVPTPLEFMEPGCEYLYNLGGRPGRQINDMQPASEVLTY